MGKFRKQTDDIFSYFSQKIGFHNLCQLPSKETSFMNCQSLFFDINKKNIHNVVLKILPSMLSIKDCIFINDTRVFFLHASLALSHM